MQGGVQINEVQDQRSEAQNQGRNWKILSVGLEV